MTRSGIKAYDKQQRKTVSEETLITLAQKGDTEAMTELLQRYKPLVIAKTQMFFLPDADREDLIQEGMIGLFKSIMSYHSEKGLTFSQFAAICIFRHVGSAVRKSTSLKNQVLNSSFSFSEPVMEGSKRTFEDILPISKTDPAVLYAQKEDVAIIEEFIEKKLSPTEKTVLRGYLNGKSYHEISLEIGKSTKTVDNALQRVRRKTAKLMNLDY